SARPHENVAPSANARFDPEQSREAGNAGTNPPVAGLALMHRRPARGLTSPPREAHHRCTIWLATPSDPIMPLFVLPFPAIDPVAVSFGPIAIRWYALAYI